LKPEQKKVKPSNDGYLQTSAVICPYARQPRLADKLEELISTSDSKDEFV